MKCSFDDCPRENSIIYYTHTILCISYMKQDAFHAHMQEMTLTPKML